MSSSPVQHYERRRYQLKAWWCLETLVHPPTSNALEFTCPFILRVDKIIRHHIVKKLLSPAGMPSMSPATALRSNSIGRDHVKRSLLLGCTRFGSGLPVGSTPQIVKTRTSSIADVAERQAQSRARTVTE
eukprot:COSAG02_NODE_6398_length_3599_cov_4.417143_3_plen_130_part_00